jgi:anaerobic selenocysteine-containing dehydrogenase
VEGDPDHPINRGSLCPKGAALRGDIRNEERLTTPRVREAGTDHWVDISWDDAVTRIARRIKDTRDATFEATDAAGRTVNRTPGLAVIGGCTDANEVNYLLIKAARSLGVLYLENQARI